MLSIENLQHRIGNKEILRDISTEFAPGKFHVIVGPNGSGKSTFLKVFSGELKPQSGSILYDEKDIFYIGKTNLAKRRAVMSQQPELHFPLAVSEIVMMGRYPHFTYKPSKDDEAICLKAMQKMEVDDLVERDYLTLSGGEKQRVQFARVLAQVWEAGEADKKFLFLDEAVSHLDIKYQHQLLQTAKEFCRKQTTVIAILHDLNLAITYADRILFMKQGKVAHELFNIKGISPEIIKEVFDVNAKIIYSNDEKPVVVF